MTKYRCCASVVASCGNDRDCLQRQRGHINCSDGITTSSCTYCIGDSSRTIKEMTKYRCRECVVANCGIDRDCLQRQRGHINCPDGITTCSSTYCIGDSSRTIKEVITYGCSECVCTARSIVDRCCLKRFRDLIYCADSVTTSR